MQKELIELIKNSDKNINRILKDIHLALFNLKIEQAKIKEVNGIQPIANYLENALKDMESYLEKSEENFIKLMESENR